MVESGINGIGVNLSKGDFEMSANSSQIGSWSLGCDIIIEDADAEIQEIKVNDITLTGSFSIKELSVDVNPDVSSDLEIDVNFGIGVIYGGIKEDLDEIRSWIEDVEDSIRDVSGAMSDINDALSDISKESINIKTTINGIQQEVNDIGTEMTTKASVDSVIEIGEQITEVQKNVAEQTIRVDSLSAEISTKASAESVTNIADALEITNKSLAEQTIKVDDLTAEVSTKASASMVTAIEDSLKITNDALAEQKLRVDAVSAEISTKANVSQVTELEGGLKATNDALAEQAIRINALDVEISTKASVDSVTELGDGLLATSESLAEQIIKVSNLESEISTKASTESVTKIGDQISLTNSTLAEQIIRTDELEASIENLVTKESFDAATGNIKNQFTSVKQTTDSIETTIKSQSGEIAAIREDVNGLSVGINKVESDLDSLRNQLDGVTESYFFDYVPTLENEPAASWISNGTEKEHEGDTFTNTATEGDDAGKSWRWLQDAGGNWGWHIIADTDAQKALLLAAQAQATADGKVTIFYEQPKNYKVGDIWFVHNNDYSPYQKGEILSAIEDSVAFYLELWEPKTRYTEAVKELDETMNTTFRDGVIDDAERKSIVTGLANLEKEKSAVDARYNILLINSNFTDEELKKELKSAKTSYDTAYDSLSGIVNQIINAETEELKGLFLSYETASATYGGAYAAYISCDERVNEALMGRLNPANVYLDNITNDGVLTPVEKEQLYEIYRGIAKEYDATRGNAYNYKIWKYKANGITEEAGLNGGDGRYEAYVALKTAYSHVVDVFNSEMWGFNSMDESTTLPEGYSTTQLKGYLDDYYEAHGELTKAFSAITAAIEEAQKKAEQTLNELTGILSPEEMYTQIGKGVVLSTIIATRDTEGRITAGMNASESQSDKSEDNHGRVVFVGGVRDINDFNDASFVVYEDGHVKMSSAEISDYASVGQLQMGLDAKANVSDFNDLLVIVNNFINSYSKMWRFDENGNLVTEHNVVSMKEISAGGAATPEEGGAGLDEEELQDYLDEKGYITEKEVDAKIAAVDVSDQLKDYATKKDVDDRFEQLIGEAPEALDTLKEIADALAEDDNVAAGIIKEVNTVKSQVALHNTAITALEQKNEEQDNTIGQIQQKDEEQDASLLSLDGRVTNNTTEIENMAILREWYRTVGAFIGKDERGIYTDENFRSSKEISAGGAAEEGEGGGESGETTGEYKMYHHVQADASKEWRIEHRLGKYPNVRIVDSNKMLCYGDVKYINDSVLTITFGAAEKGDAYCD